MVNSYYIQQLSAKLKRRTSVSLLWHGEEIHKHCYVYDTRLCHSSCSHHLLRHFVVPCCPLLSAHYKKTYICNIFYADIDRNCTIVLRDSSGGGQPNQHFVNSVCLAYYGRIFPTLPQTLVILLHTSFTVSPAHAALVSKNKSLNL